MKYVMNDEGEFLLFPELMVHSRQKIRLPTSAGFVQIYENNGQIKVRCYGESETLKMASNPERDEPIILRYLQ